MVDSKRPNSMRLQDVDYGSPAAYFITICTHLRKCNLAVVENSQNELTEIGRIVQDCWLSLPKWFSHVNLDHFVIMPNHVHGILNFIDSGSSLGTVVGTFKSASSRLVKGSLLGQRECLWQRGFYDHIVRSEKALFRLRQYIEDNPAQWCVDELNSDFAPQMLEQGDAWRRPYSSLESLLP